MRLICNRSDFRDLAGVQKCICGTAEGSPDVKSDNEPPRGARVGSTCCIHDRDKSKARDRVCDRSMARDFKYFFGSHHTFLYGRR